MQLRDDGRGAAAPDEAHDADAAGRVRGRVAPGHALTRDISSGNIAAKLLVEAVRPLVNEVAERHARLLGWPSATQCRPTGCENTSS